MGASTHPGQVFADFMDSPEHPDEAVVEVTGAVPPEIRGTLYRNGPARWHGGGFSAGHLFDGDGLVSKFTIADGAVRFRNRYVRTPRYLAIENGKGASVRGLGTLAKGGVLGNALRPPRDTANTHAVWHVNRLLALTDNGRPWQIDPEDLATLGVCDFSGALSRLSSFSPHPRIDPATGEMFNFGLAPVGSSVADGRRGRYPVGLRCYRIGPDGKLTTLARLPLGNAFINHDFTITQKYLVFVIPPLVVDPVQGALAVLGLKTFEAASRYAPELGTLIALVPRDGGPVRYADAPALAYVHCNNAYDDGDDVVVDVARYDSWDEISNRLRDYENDGAFPAAALTRLRIGASGRVEVEDLVFGVGEFPSHDSRHTGREHRFGYFATIDPDRPRVVKVDHETGAVAEHVFAPLDFPGEPVFVPRSADAKEDDGWLLTVTYLAEQERSALVVLDARAVDAEPVAVVAVPAKFMPGFHGSFVAA